MLRCQHCGSTHIQRRGFSQGDEPMQRVRCMRCDKWGVAEIERENDDLRFTLGDTIKELLENHRTFIISSAQNNTALNMNAWKSMMQYKKHRDAAVLILPVKYQWNRNESEIWYPGEVMPYLTEDEIHLHPLLRVMGQVRITATMTNPLSGLDSLTQGASGIFGHGQIQMKTVATPQHALPKMLYTTGSVSVKNYSHKKTGVKGEFHHSPGFIVVELDAENDFHMRSVTIDDNGEFYDLDHHATPRGVKKVKSVDALVLGDEHVIRKDEGCVKATFDGPHSLVSLLKPKKLVRHDVFDGHSISHHHRNSPVTRYRKWWCSEDSLEDELKITAEHVIETTPKNCQSLMVPSNHHNHLNRWLEEADPKQEPWNALLYHELMFKWLGSFDDDAYFDPFEYAMRKYVNEKDQYKVRFLKQDEPYLIKDILISLHGDKGPDGSRGSVNSLRKIGAKTIIGHRHSPCIDKGCYQVGTSSLLNLDYTSGPSSWLHTHCIIHPNGKRQLVHIINGKFRRETAQ